MGIWLTKQASMPYHISNLFWGSSVTTRGLLVTDHVILNHGQVTWTTPELAPPSPNYRTTPKALMEREHPDWSLVRGKWVGL
ncbi:hypothetical protein TNCV_1058131 [Trichonephila clavipes]|nr:hypothetical protein TNCV_1058131 [Trichonephila clavipes]